MQIFINLFFNKTKKKRQEHLASFNFPLNQENDDNQFNS